MSRDRAVAANLTNATAAIEQALVEWSLPGVVVGITDRCELRGVAVHGYADLKARSPLTAEARFGIGSITKSFTAMAILQLATEGRLDLHAPITRYLKGLTLDSPFEPISAHHLLSHTSGLPFYLVHVSSSRYVLAALRDIVPGYAPGSHWWYSNTGYQLLGYVLENLDGMSYANAIRRRVLSPLGMASTSAIIDDAERSRTVTSYVQWPECSYVEAPWYEYTAGDGCLISTVPDMCAYARCILNRGSAPAARLLSEVAFRTWTTPVRESCAYGLFVKHEEEDTRISHNGGIGGFHSELEVNLKGGFGVVMLSSSRIPGELKRWIINVVRAAFSGHSPPITPVRRQSWRIEEYAGVYRLASASQGMGDQALEFTVANGRLALKEGHDFRPLLRMGKDCFRLADRDAGGLPFFFGRVAEAGEGAVVEVSRGAQWYVTEAFAGERELAAPQEYSAYVGHFQNNDPEGPTARLFVRNGRLWASLDQYVEEVTPIPLERLEPDTFRVGQGLGEHAHSPERVRFDTFVDGHALRMTLSGVPLYRRDSP